ncbi:hypothetical protein HYH03_003604 [Edaphochlamys debaryana]|uniref:Uncharacterized protein n=1 Tax=Edaphochlamys debaryana TaxID=47281 RepID=A0A835Y8R4_9CHLO|nr:hypothetical protein HYH03_003604 [Edaphochlamys debaryana]|eukprot:KAG2498345.1 hypothetical protein HYH03_003604 [Edaphochlamys debaryana]
MMLAAKPLGTVATRRSSAAVARPSLSRRALRTKALLGPDGTPGAGPTGKKDKKFISRDEEPDQYWSSKGEAAGENPMKDPLALIGVLAILFPFIFVLVAIATGAIDVSVYR